MICPSDLIINILSTPNNNYIRPLPRPHIMSEPTGLTQVANATKSAATTNEISQIANQTNTGFAYLYIKSDNPNIRNVGFGSVEITDEEGKKWILSDAVEYEPDTLKYRIIRRLRRFITFIRDLGTNRKK